MTLQEFYESINGDYKGTVMRMMNREAMVTKFLGKFLATTDYDDMEQALDAGDYETAFRASHNLKGMALNLGLTKLGNSGSALCDTMRHGAPTADISELRAQVAADYAETVSAIKEFLG